MTMTLSRTCAVVLLVVAALVAPRAWAAAGDDCTVSLGGGLNFGNYDPGSGSPATAQGQIQIDCNRNATPVTISMGPGANGTIANRRMKLGTQFLSYNLYLDPGFSTIFGNGATGSTVTCTTGDGNNANGCTGSNPAGGTRRTVRPFYGLMPASQNVSDGVYTDTVTYTVTF